MPIFSAATTEKRQQVARYLNRAVKAPYVNTEVSTLGGVERASALVKGSLDRREHWSYGILHNSRYFMLRIDRDGTVELFAKGLRMPKMRKTKVKTLVDAVRKINQYLSGAR